MLYASSLPTISTKPAFTSMGIPQQSSVADAYSPIVTKGPHKWWQDAIIYQVCRSS